MCVVALLSELELAKPLPHTLITNLFSSFTFIFFPSSATILLVVWSANGNGSDLTSKASSKVNY